MIDKNFESFLQHLKSANKDNDIRTEGKSPCCFSIQPRTKEDIDKPFFEENEWKNFWELTKKYYPLHSVSGSEKSPQLIIDGEADRFKRKLQNKLDKNFFEKKKNIRSN